MTQKNNTNQNKQENSSKFPLSELQKSYYVEKRLNGASEGCRVYYEFLLEKLDTRWLTRCFNCLIKNHDMLRVKLDNTGKQTISEPFEYSIYEKDFSSSESKDEQLYLKKIRNKMENIVFMPNDFPYFDIRITHLHNDKSMLHMSFDEWIVDGKSVEIILNELFELYENELSEIESDTGDFKNYITCKLDENSSEQHSKDKGYYIQHFSKLVKASSFIFQNEIANKKREHLSYILSVSETDEFKKKSKANNVSPTALLLHNFKESINNLYSENSYPLIITMSERKDRYGLKANSVGPYVGTALFLSEKSDGLKEVQHKLWATVDHQDISGIEVLRKLKNTGVLTKDYSIPIVFTSMLASINERSQKQSWFSNRYYSSSQTPNIALDCQIFEADKQIEVHWELSCSESQVTVLKECFADFCQKISGAVSESPILSPLQKSYYIQERLSSSSKYDRIIYQELAVYEEDTKTILARIEESLRRFPQLTTVVNNDGHFERRELEEYPVLVENITEFTHETKEKYLNDYRAKVLKVGFSQFSLPRMLIKLFEIENKQHLISVMADSALMDGQSFSLFYSFLLNGNQNNNVTMAFPKKVVSKFDDGHDEYWQKKTAGLQPGPFVERIKNHSQKSIIRKSFEIEEEELIERVKNSGITVDTFLIACYIQCLEKWYGEDFSIVTIDWNTVEGEQRPLNSIGDYTNISWINSGIHKQTILAYAKDMQTQIDIEEKMDKEKSILYQRKNQSKLKLPVVYTYPAQPTEALGKFLFGLTRTPEVLLDCLSFIHNGVRTIAWDYASDCFSETEIDRFFTYFSQTIQETTFPKNITISEKFDQICLKYPARPAIKYGNKEINYQTLNQEATFLAKRLYSKGIQKGDLIAVSMDKSSQLIVAIFALLKMGCVYVPIDTKLPEERVSYILEDSGSRCVICDENSYEFLRQFEIDKMNIAIDWDHVERDAIFKPAFEAVTSEDAVYCIYTSGSTGNPKGVLVSHGNMMSLFEEAEKEFDFSEKDIWTMYHSYGFDFSIWEIFGALLFGGKLIIVPYGLSRSFEKFYNLLIEEQVTVLNQTPTAFKRLLSIMDSRCSELKLSTIIFGGEALYFPDLDEWFKNEHLRKTNIYNMYGITEITIHGTIKKISFEEMAEQRSLIGRELGHLNIMILDESLEEVPNGEIGEIAVAGSGVALGYLNKTEMTKEKFVKLKGQRVYLSGDLGKKIAFNEIEYIGRKDNQIQIRGFRVELSEIEEKIKAIPEVNDCIVVASSSKEKKIKAFIVNETDRLSEVSIRKKLRKILPDYMIPQNITLVKNLPLTVNGKVDTKRLTQLLKDEANEMEARQIISLNEIKTYFKFELGKEDLDVHEDIFNFGASSLSLINFIDWLAETKGIQAEIDILLSNPTLSQIHNTLTKLKGPATSEINEGMKTDTSTTKKEETYFTGIPADFLSKLVDFLKHELELSEIDLEEDLFNQGADSLTLVNLKTWLNDSIKVDVDIDVLLENPSINTIYDFCINNIELMEQGDRKIPKLETNQSDVKSIRKPMKQQNLTVLLKALSASKIKGKTVYSYPTAGGKNCIQTYVWVKNVNNYDSGLYYYNPEEHTLEKITEKVEISLDSFALNQQQLVMDSGFILFFIAQLAALQPVYLGFAEGLAHVDYGYINQLLYKIAQEQKLSFNELSLADFSQACEQFKLSDTHKFIGATVVSNEHIKYDYTPDLSHYKEKPTFYSVQKQNQLYENMAYNTLSRKEIIELARRKIHIRKDLSESQKIKIELLEPDEQSYFQRSCKRTYLEIADSNYNLKDYLAFVLGNTAKKSSAHLSFNDLYLIDVYLYLKQGILDDKKEGIYRWQKESENFEFICSVTQEEIINCHTPFNRKHVKAAHFEIFLTVDYKKAQNYYGEPFFELLLEESGKLGQAFMDSQSKFNIGAVPIGGMKADTFLEKIGKSTSHVFLHSLIGGGFAYNDEQESLSIVEDKQQSQSNIKYSILGMALRFPDADNGNEFWLNLVQGRNAIRKLQPGERSGFTKESSDYVGGFLANIDTFDFSRFNMSLDEAKYLDPQVRLFLTVAGEALEDAGIEINSKQKKNIGVYIGTMYQHFYLNALDDIDADLISIQSYSAIANRTSYYYNLSGPSVAVDTACSSSVYALKQAMDDLEKGRCDYAIVGGVNLTLHEGKYSALKKMGLLSESEVSKCFGTANGFLPGEGVAAIVIAKCNKANVQSSLATIDSLEIGHTGQTSGYSIPSSKSEENLIRCALKSANLEPNDISYIEASANGSRLGDAAEYSALKKVFSELKRDHIFMGSVKANIGHLEAVSGMSQIIKTILMLKYKKIVKTINIDEINSLINTTDSKLKIIEEDIDLDYSKKLTHILINNFAAGGSNASLVISDALPQSDDSLVADGESDNAVWLLSGNSRKDLESFSTTLFELLNSGTLNAKQIEASLILRPQTGTHRRAIVFTDVLMNQKPAETAVIFEGSQVETSGLDSRIIKILQSRISWSTIIDALVEEADIESLAELWVNGVDISWRDIRKTSIKEKHFIGSPLFSMRKIPQINETIITNEKERLVELNKNLQEENDIKVILSNLLGEKLDSNDRLREIGFNSIYALKIIEIIDQHYGLTCSLAEVMKLQTVHELEKLVSK